MSHATHKLVTNPHPEAKWFLEGGNKGLFLHWGISAVCAHVDLSWGMYKYTGHEPHPHRVKPDRLMTPNTYYRQAEYFHPESWRPREILQAAKDAGFNYAVLTTKHHDGYALWPSSVGELNTATHSDGQDYVQDFVDVCRDLDMKIGLYYSPPDWYYVRDYFSFGRHRVDPNDPTADQAAANQIHYDMGHNETKLPEAPEGFYKKMVEEYTNVQIRELLTRYGDIDLLWFDGASHDNDYAISIEEIRELQPHILMTPRLHDAGDYLTYECMLPDEDPQVPWEHCHIWQNGGGWGYMIQAHGYKPTDWVMEQWENVKKWNGNFLLNVAPNPEGRMPRAFYPALRELGKAWE